MRAKRCSICISSMLSVDSKGAFERYRCHPGQSFGSIFGSNLASQNPTFSLLSDTESTKLFLVRDQEVGGSNPLAPTNYFRNSNLQESE